MSKIYPEDDYEDYSEDNGNCCLNCGREMVEREYMEHNGICWMCRGMGLHQGFPGPPGFPGM